ncbi:unnamed protein product [Allacma fusca]|uniref:Uncharacterized protein n=1 Tax=Allacma fusca TaxID=39272 RepID=A0A8J2JIG2_9HEXA|nr:unnamed protein product [Allacma fusca]
MKNKPYLWPSPSSSVMPCNARIPDSFQPCSFFRFLQSIRGTFQYVVKIYFYFVNSTWYTFTSGNLDLLIFVSSFQFTMNKESLFSCAFMIFFV